MDGSMRGYRGLVDERVSWSMRGYRGRVDERLSWTGR